MFEYALRLQYPNGRTFDYHRESEHPLGVGNEFDAFGRTWRITSDVPPCRFSSEYPSKLEAFLCHPVGASGLVRTTQGHWCGAAVGEAPTHRLGGGWSISELESDTADAEYLAGLRAGLRPGRWLASFASDLWQKRGRLRPDSRLAQASLEQIAGEQSVTDARWSTARGN